MSASPEVHVPRADLAAGAGEPLHDNGLSQHLGRLAHTLHFRATRAAGQRLQAWRQLRLLLEALEARRIHVAAQGLVLGRDLADAALCELQAQLSQQSTCLASRFSHLARLQLASAGKETLEVALGPEDGRLRHLSPVGREPLPDSSDGRLIQFLREDLCRCSLHPIFASSQRVPLPGDVPLTCWPWMHQMRWLDLGLELVLQGELQNLDDGRSAFYVQPPGRRRQLGAVLEHGAAQL
mmetsp:Transcript_123537/g.384583  ORF Transcript_123537/g.384583 Transcript_123537/m.384583 type:complete len:238 (-) Transcript_123537:236-949(-)